MAIIPGDAGALADSRFIARRVRIRSDLSLDGAWQAYYHETVHIALFDGSLHLDPDDEERVADAVANALVAGMRRR